MTEVESSRLPFRPPPFSCLSRSPPMCRRWLKSVLIVAVVCCLTSLGLSRFAAAVDKSDHLARILMVTQSKGFQHSSVTRKNGDLSTAERTLTELGMSSGLFKVDCTQDAAKDFTKDKLANYDIVFFYT